MRPNAHRDALLYVSNSGTGGVTVYSYKSGGTPQLEGELFGFQSPLGECTNAKGDVFIVDFGARMIKQYAHGAITPTTTISDALGIPYSCAVNAASGELAVTNLENSSGTEPGNVIVYPASLGSPIEYSDATLYEPLFCDYDGKGNLYVDAYDDTNVGRLGVLHHGNQSFTILNVSGGTIPLTSGLLADGRQLLVANLYYPAVIYRVTVSGSTATIVGSLSLPHGSTVAEFAKYGSASTAAVIVPDYDNSNVKGYSFPGGSPLFTLTSEISQPAGAVVSQVSR